jgi:hypothetical protein
MALYLEDGTLADSGHVSTQRAEFGKFSQVLYVFSLFFCFFRKIQKMHFPPEK